MIKEENASLNFEWKWKKSINFYNCNHLNWNFEQKQIVWPSELKWKVILIVILKGLITIQL